MGRKDKSGVNPKASNVQVAEPPSAVAPTSSSGEIKWKTWGFVIGPTVAVLVFAFTQYGSYQQFVGVTDQRLKAIETNITKLSDTNEKLLERLHYLEKNQPQQRALETIKGLAQPAFERSLPKLADMFSQQPEYVSPETIKSIAQRLDTADSSSPKYWPALFGFIRYASTLTSDDAPPRRAVDVTIQGITFNGGNSPFEDLVVRFDGARLNRQRFTRCRIIFAGHPTIITDTVFVNCVFEFEESSTPSKGQEKAARLLLAQAGMREVSLSLP